MNLPYHRVLPKLKTFITFAILLVITSLTLACTGEPTPVRIGSELAYPPFSFINESGEYDGLEVELADELCKRANLECTWVQNDWDSIIPNLLEEQYDVIIAGMSVTEKRTRTIDFTQPYIPPSPSAYISMPGSDDSVVDGRVAVQVGTVQEDYLVKSGLTPVVYDLAEEMITGVLNGEADAAMADKSFLENLIAENSGQLVFIGPEVALDSGIGIGLRKGDDELKSAMNEAIAGMKDDGTLNRIIKKWLGEDAEVF